MGVGGGDVLSLSTDNDCFNGAAVNDVISYFEYNQLKDGGGSDP